MSLGGIWEGRHGATKVATPGALFWAIKLLSTGMGETTSDFFIKRYEPVLVVALGGVLLVAALVVQLTRRRFLPWAYWTAVVMVSVFGTMAADVVHVLVGIPYIVSTIFFAVLLAATFVVWYGTEGTLSVHSINNARRETFYWIVVITTFALGTATGDLTASTFRLGYLASGLLFLALFIATAAGSWAFGANPIMSFWIAYILTRPVGASFADWMGVPPVRGGLNWGTGLVSIVLAAVILALVVAASVLPRPSDRITDL